MVERPTPHDPLLWDIAQAIAAAVRENPPPRPVGRIAARAVLDAIERDGWELRQRERVDG